MGTISIIEFAVYGFVCYSSILMLIISTIKEIPNQKAMAIARSVFLIPGIICAGVLASSGVDITINSVQTSTLIKNLNNTDTWTQNDLTSNTIILENPVWITIHWLFFVVMLVYVAQQILILLTKQKKEEY